MSEYIQHMRLHGIAYHVRIIQVVVINTHSAYLASDAQADAIMLADAEWHNAQPCWAQNFIPDIFSTEDLALLQEMRIKL